MKTSSRSHYCETRVCVFLCVFVCGASVKEGVGSHWNIYRITHIIVLIR